MASLRSEVAYRVGVALGVLSLPYFFAREYVHRTYFHQSWLARNRRVAERLDSTLEQFDELVAGGPQDERWPDLLERIDTEHRRKE